jgi:uncharacterized phiE125 gp8 family phage protein
MAGEVFDNSFYTVTVAPAELPVSVAEFKAFAKIDFNDEDDLIAIWLQAATDVAEKYTRRCFVTRTVEGRFYSLLFSPYAPFPYVQIDRAPLIAVSAVEVWNGSAYVAYTDTEIKNRSGYSRVLYKETLPAYSTTADTAYPIKVTFTAGYGAASAVSAPIKVAIMMLANWLYQERGDCACENPNAWPGGVAAMLSGYRILGETA